jgi:uncharacterized membrane protein YidH (DUF202 family)
MDQKKIPDINIGHLAVERTELALERTHLSWIRTLFAIISIGLAVDKVAEAIHNSRIQQGTAFFKEGHIIGLFLTVTGTLLLAVETFQYMRRFNQLRKMRGEKPRWITTSLVSALLVILLGISLSYFVYS